VKHFGFRTAGFVCGAMAVGCGAASEDRDARVVTELTSALKPVVEGTSAFTLDFYAQAAAEKSGNLFASPLSIAAVLAVLERGAAGQTAEELRAALHIGADEAQYHREFGRLMSDLGGEHAGRGYELSIANRLFIQDGFALEADYVSQVAADYGPGVESVDFKKAAAVEHVNGWISDATRGLVPKLFGTFDPQTLLAVANAIYFQGRWAEPFDKDSTSAQAFWVAPTESKQVPTMYGSDAFGCGGDTNVRVVELDYKDNELSMLILMPGDFSDPFAPSVYTPLAELEASLSPARLNTLLSSLHECHGSLSLPKFVIASQFDLVPTLSALGISRAFSPTADFSRMTDVGVHIEQALHKAYVEVDEGGTKAAAATGFTATTDSASAPWTIDNPFVFLIRDKLTGSILFIGRITDPTQSAE
jgi:serpin B